MCDAVGIEVTGGVMRSMLVWYWSEEQNDWVKSCIKLVMDGTTSVGRRMKMLQDDLNLMDINNRDAQDCAC